MSEKNLTFLCAPFLLWEVVWKSCWFKLQLKFLSLSISKGGFERVLGSPGTLWAPQRVPGSWISGISSRSAQAPQEPSELHRGFLDFWHFSPGSLRLFWTRPKTIVDIEKDQESFKTKIVVFLYYIHTLHVKHVTFPFSFEKKHKKKLWWKVSTSKRCEETLILSAYFNVLISIYSK